MMDHFKQHLGLQVRAARKRAGLTQEELAGHIGRTPESVSNIERRLQLPSIETLIDLSGALGVPIAEFFEEVASAGSKPVRSAERVAVETRLREIARELSDRDLAVAVEQVNVLLTIH